MKNFNLFFLAAIALFAATSCGSKENVGWTVNGTINGVADDTVIMRVGFGLNNTIKVPLKDGKFTVKGTALAEPTRALFSVQKQRLSFDFYVDNGTFTYVGDVVKSQYSDANGNSRVYSYMKNNSIEGSIINTHVKFIRDYASSINKELDTAAKAKFGNTNYYGTAEYNAMKAEADKKIENYKLDFVKKNPKAFYSGEIISEMTYGKNSNEQKKLLALLDPNLKHSKIDKIKGEVSKSMDVNISEAITASNVSYKVDASFDGTAFTKAKYLGTLSNGNLVALNDDKTATIIDTKGKKVKSFNVSEKEVPSTMAIDEKDNIYVMIPEMKEVEHTYRGKTTKRKQIVAYNCDIFDINGKKQKSFKIEGVKQATGARVANNKLMIADMLGRNIGIFNATTGVSEAKIENMRPCCGILDFSINDKNELLVANLGAFRVQSYDLTGKQILAFGSRGTGLNEFHGCCNPVSVAYLSNGAIVTVEKDPTRVKVYSKEGAMAIAGIDEMVKGCNYIPMTTDKKDNLYLASPNKGVVRCVAI